MKSEPIESYLIENWPPRTIDPDNAIIYRKQQTKNGRYVKRYSNKWTQYLEYLLINYIRKRKSKYLLREIPCINDKNKKLDYMLISGNPEKMYFGSSDARSDKLPWFALIEAQWDQNKHVRDFLGNDFGKLCMWEPNSSKGKSKIAIFNVRVSKNNTDSWQDVHKKEMGKIKKIIDREDKTNSKYCLLITSRIARKKIVVYSCYVGKPLCKEMKQIVIDKKREIQDPKSGK